jgi:hypothetical protein
MTRNNLLSQLQSAATALAASCSPDEPQLGRRETEARRVLRLAVEAGVLAERDVAEGLRQARRLDALRRAGQPAPALRLLQLQAIPCRDCGGNPCQCGGGAA